MKPLSDIQTLVAIEAICQLVGRRVHALDTQQWDEYAACHAPDHMSHGAHFAPDAGRDGMMAELRRVYTGIRSVHVVHSPVITIVSRDEATGIWGLEDRLFWKEGAEEHWAHGWGFYDEGYRRVDGAWLFRSRRLTYLRRDFSPGSRRMSGNATTTGRA